MDRLVCEICARLDNEQERAVLPKLTDLCIGYAVGVTGGTSVECAKTDAGAAGGGQLDMSEGVILMQRLCRQCTKKGWRLLDTS